MQEFTGNSVVTFQLKDNQLMTIHLRSPEETKKLIEFMMVMIADISDDIFDLNNLTAADEVNTIHNILFPTL
jgi:hypothetical protein